MNRKAEANEKKDGVKQKSKNNKNKVCKRWLLDQGANVSRIN